MPDVFQFYHTSSDSFPGKGTGEILESPKETYVELSKYLNWRRVLSNFGDSPFVWKGLRWQTAEHAYQASRFELDHEDKARDFSLDSNNTEINTDPMKAKKWAESVKFPRDLQAQWDEGKTNILNDIWRAKFTENKMAHDILLATKNAQLWHAMRGNKEHWISLETLRGELITEKAAADIKRNALSNKEMADTSAKSPKKSSRKNAKVAPVAPVAEEVAGAVTANSPSIVTNGASVNDNSPVYVPQVSETDAQAMRDALYEKQVSERKDSSIRFCTVCNNYLYLMVDETSGDLQRMCRNCGYKDVSEQGGLVSEVRIEQLSAEGYNLINEFTLKDPRLPHLRGSMKCVNDICPTNVSGKESDVVYIKYDNENLRYIYICTVCETNWRSRR